MNRLESIVKWIAVTACLVGASGTSFAAAPDAAAPDHPLAPLTAAYVRAVTPGQQADTYRELLGVVLARVQRSFALEVDTPAFIAAALSLALRLFSRRSSVSAARLTLMDPLHFSTSSAFSA